MQNVFDFHAAPNQRARNQPIPVTMFVIGFAAQKRDAATFGQRQQLVNARQILRRIGHCIVIHLAALKIKLLAFGPPADAIAQIHIFDALLVDGLFQRFAAEMRVVAAVRLTARVHQRGNFVPPKQIEKSVNRRIAVAYAEEFHGERIMSRLSETGNKTLHLF